MNAPAASAWSVRSRKPCIVAVLALFLANPPAFAQVVQRHVDIWSEGIRMSGTAY